MAEMMMATTSNPRIDTLTARRMFLLQKAKTLVDGVEKEGRAVGEADEKLHAQLLAEIDSIDKRLEEAAGDDMLRERLDKLTGGGERRAGHATARGAAGSWGQQFMAATVDFFKNGLHRSSSAWATPTVELRAETVTETVSPIAVPQVLPGIVPGPAAPIVMSQLFAPGTATSNAITFMAETLWVPAADAVAEGAAKPEATLRFAPVTTPLTKIPVWIPVSDEALEDIPQLGAYIDARLVLGVLIALDREVLVGSGTAPHMKGLLGRTDLAPAVAATGNGIDAIAQQIGAIESAQQLPVDGIVLNSADWLAMGLVKSTTGEYLSGSPFTQAGPLTLFGRRVATTPTMPKGTALVGSFRSGGGQLFQRGGVNVAASNSHQDYFIKNLVAIRAEIRAALCLYRPAAFGLVTGLP